MDNFFAIYKNILIDNIKLNKRLFSLYFENNNHQIHKYHQIIDDIFYVLKTGISWRQIRSNIKWQTLYWHFAQLVKQNIFKTTFDRLIKQYKHDNGNILVTDTSFIQNKFGINKIGRNKFFKNKNCNKISLITNEKGAPLSISIDKGTLHDLSFLDKHIKTICLITKKKDSILLADKAYHSNIINKKLSAKNINIMIQRKKNMKEDINFDSKIYKKRIIIENTFQKIKNFRRINIRYDKLLKTFLNFSYFAVSIVFLQVNYTKIDIKGI